MSSIGFHLMDHAGLTDVGIRRSHNQDAFAVVLANDEESWRERGHLFLVADGMGAHAVGELASKLAADLIPHTYQKHADQGARPALRRAFEEANEHIYQKGQQNPEFEGMGTTSTALLLRPEGAWVAHVGDSRAYRIRGGLIEQLSYDHSLHWELARRQRLRPEQIMGVPNNVIVRSLGPEPVLQTEIEGPHPVMPGDIYLLCSDGLSNPLKDEEMGAVAAALPASEAAQLLVDLANYRGGPDNITVTVIRLPGDSSAPATGRLRNLRRPWNLHIQLPWSAAALGAGTGLAVMALLVMLMLKAQELALAAFILATGLISFGLVGLYRDQRRSHRVAESEDDDQRPPRVHRQTSCQITPALLARFLGLQTDLLRQVRSRDWPMDWPRYQHLAAIRAREEKVDLKAAFAAQCRQLGLLTEAVRKNRNKGEVFSPNWVESPRNH